MAEPTKEQIRAFLAGLAELSERTQVVVTGCVDGACHCSMMLRLADDCNTTKPIRYIVDDRCGPILVDVDSQHGGEGPGSDHG